MELPNDEWFKKCEPQMFSNEPEVQRFVEDHVLPACGLTRLSSSLVGRGRLYFIDTLAIDAEGTPFLFEYKWDLVDLHTMMQTDGYRRWLFEHKEQADDAARKSGRGIALLWDRLHVVTVGHRFHPSAARDIDPTSSITFLRYGRLKDRTPFLVEVP